MGHWMKQSPSPCTRDHDELTLIKAAAWAWYQRGSGRCNLSASRESELTIRTRSTTPRPTRYKLESESESEPPLSSSSSSLLLDLYEIERITQELNDLIGSGKRDQTRGPIKRVENFKKVSGFWVRQAVGICGSRGDVVEAAVLGGRRRGKPRTVT